MVKTSDVDIVIVPGWSSSGPEHWQSRWERNLPTARRISQDDWLHPRKDAWVGCLISALAEAKWPCVVVAHSLGVLTLDNPYCRFERAAAFAETWGAQLIDADTLGHINVASGHGPWPDGLMRFGGFLKRLG